MRVSRRLEAVQPPVIPVVGDLLRSHPGTISLGQGIVHYGPPPEVDEALRDFHADPARNKYGPVEGQPALLDALRRKLELENGCRVGPERRVVATAGGNMGFLNAILAIADAGDEVVLNAPYYFNHEMAVGMAGCRAVLVETDDSYQLRLDAIAKAITPRTRAVVTVSPNNPTGAVYPAEALGAVNALCRDRGLFHIHDEAYEYFTYAPARHFSPGSLPDAAGHTISLYSLSKGYGMASWRVGYMVVPEVLADAINKIQDTLLICPPAASQRAAAAALAVGAAYPRSHLAQLDAMRHAIFAALSDRAVPCDVAPVAGAFYYLVRVHSTLDAMTLVERLIREHQVATIPGSAFADAAPCSIRLSYGALEPQVVAEGIGRLVKGLQALC